MLRGAQDNFYYALRDSNTVYLRRLDLGLTEDGSFKILK